MNRAKDESGDSEMDSVSDSDEVELISESSTETFMKELDKLKTKLSRKFDRDTREQHRLEEMLLEEKVERLRLEKEILSEKTRFEDQIKKLSKEKNDIEQELIKSEQNVNRLERKLKKLAAKAAKVAAIFSNNSDVSDAEDNVADNKRPNEFDTSSIHDERDPSTPKRLKTADSSPPDPSVSSTFDFEKEKERPSCHATDFQVEFEPVQRNGGAADINVPSIDNVQSDWPVDVSNYVDVVVNEVRCSSPGSSDDDDMTPVWYESAISTKPRLYRRNIKKIMEHDELSSETKKAYQKEEERKNRSARRLQKYNEAYGALPGELNKMDQLLLDFDPETKAELLTVDRRLSTKLKPHQCEGVKFMWDACFESIEKLRSSKGSGCVLSHCMGLGKTLQVIALTHTLLRHSDITKVSKVLILCPINVILNWIDEFNIWLGSFRKDERVNVFQLVSSNSDKRVNVVQRWHLKGGALIIGYEMFRMMCHKMEKNSFEALIDPGADLVVCDEGHILKNPTSDISRAVNRVRTQRRIVLTGTPLQNNLTEYFAMAEFVKPRLLGTMAEFNNRFVGPIVNGQFVDSTAEDITLMVKQAHVLHKLLDGCVHRRDYSVLAEFLPAKEEHVLFIRLTKTQMHLYKRFTSIIINKTNPICDLPTLRRISNHPMTLADFQNRPKLRRKSTFDENYTDSESEPADNVPLKLMDWWKPTCSDDQDLGLSNKMFILLTIINECEMRNEKLVVFSGCLSTLNVIEYFLSKRSETTRNLGASSTDYKGLWTRDLDYLRLDGDRSATKRKNDVTKFNQEHNTRTRLFLISTKAGSLGINLMAANRVVIFDASWNPSDDLQSIFRVYRIGQKRKCYVYRFVALGTMEEKVYDRQVSKLGIAKRVVDKHQIERHYKEKDLQHLYNVDNLDPPTRNHSYTPTGDDDLLHSLFQKFGDIIYKHQDHDSLLENVQEIVTEEDGNDSEYTDISD